MQFLLELVGILTNYVRKTFDRSTKVLDFHHPHQLLEGMEGFNLELSDQPESLEQILVDCRDTLKYGVRTGRLLNWPQLSYMKQDTALNQMFPFHVFRTVCGHLLRFLSFHFLYFHLCNFFLSSSFEQFK